MGNIQILDCTLRDGGYCNEWKFGFDDTKKIISRLVESGVEIIECGFLTQKEEYVKGITKFTTLEEVAEVLPADRDGKMFVCMINYGEYNLDALPVYDGSSIDGLRVAFHKKDIAGALEDCKKIADKGYKVFVQPMVSLSYSDEEFVDLIRKSNEITPYAFYIVDSFGVMKRKDLRRLFYMVEHNLKDGICIGYHSHNNMQLAYSNAQSLVDIRTKKDIIFDSSIYGMGRGAGNLNTELFVQYLNDNIDTDYKIAPLLTVIDETLNAFYEKNYWGYSLPNYLSASHNAHPNYASYLDEKKTLTIEAMNAIFSMMLPEKKINYDKKYIEALYLEYMEKGIVEADKTSELKSLLQGKEVLIIAPGKSSLEEKSKILHMIEEKKLISIGINFDYTEYQTNYIFVSNKRRFRELDEQAWNRCILTTNIPTENGYLHVPYKELLNDVEDVKDNAGMMLVKFLIGLGVSKIYVAGLDGYSTDPTQNFATEKMAFVAKKDKFEAMNKGMETVLAECKKYVAIEPVTTSKYVNF